MIKHIERSSPTVDGGVKRVCVGVQMFHLKCRRIGTAVSLLPLFLVLTSALHAGVPGSTSPINIDAQGLALRGYDPVAYFEDGRPTRGIASLSASYGGARYLFVSESHRKLFLENPGKYIPEYGGFCAVGTSYGEKVDVDPTTGKIVNGKLYLNNGPKAQQIFDQDTRKYHLPGESQLAERERQAPLTWPAPRADHNRL